MKNVDKLERMLKVFENATEGDKMKYYDMIIEFAENYDRKYFAPYIDKYKSQKSEAPIEEYINDNIPLLIFFAFYKAFNDRKINVKSYFEDMFSKVSELDYHKIIPSLYMFILDDSNVEKCRFIENENLLSKKHLYYNDDIYKEFIYQNKCMKKYLELMTSILSLAADSSLSSSDKANNEKIVLSRNEMEDIYITILSYCKFRDKIDYYKTYHGYIDSIKTFGLRSILEELLNTPHLSIIDSVEKLKRESYIDNLATLIYGCSKTDNDIINLECAFLDIMRKLQNKYIYDNKLISIHQICKNYVNKDYSNSCFYKPVFIDCFNYFIGKIGDGNFLFSIKKTYEVWKIDIISDMMKDCFVEF